MHYIDFSNIFSGFYCRDHNMYIAYKHWTLIRKMSYIDFFGYILSFFCRYHKILLFGRAIFFFYIRLHNHCNLLRYFCLNFLEEMLILYRVWQINALFFQAEVDRMRWSIEMAITITRPNTIKFFFCERSYLQNQTENNS